MSSDIIGLDPGFARGGWARLRIREQGEELLSLGVLETEPSDRKRKVLVADDNVRRARVLARALREDVLAPRDGRSVVCVCAESMSHPRNASAAGKVSLFWGLVVMHVDTHGLPLLQATPQEIKLALTARRNASKDDVRAAVESRYGAALCTRLLDDAGVAEGARNHAYDALASAVACLDSEQVLLVRRLVASAKGTQK